MMRDRPHFRVSSLISIFECQVAPNKGVGADRAMRAAGKEAPERPESRLGLPCGGGPSKFWSSCVSAYMMSLLILDLASILISERRSIIHPVASRPLITVHETGQRRRTGWPTVRLVI